MQPEVRKATLQIHLCVVRNGLHRDPRQAGISLPALPLGVVADGWSALALRRRAGAGCAPFPRANAGPMPGSARWWRCTGSPSTARSSCRTPRSATCVALRRCSPPSSSRGLRSGRSRAANSRWASRWCRRGLVAAAWPRWHAHRHRGRRGVGAVRRPVRLAQQALRRPPRPAGGDRASNSAPASCC